MKIVRVDADGFQINQGTEAWKQLRIGLFTGTSMAALQPGPRGGVEARNTVIQEVVAELLTGLPVSGFKATKYVKEGIEKEPFARMLYEERTGRVVEEVAFIRHDWLRCGVSPDGLVIGARRGTEFKSPKETTHARYLLDPQQLVLDYTGQIQSNLWLTEYEEWDICSYHPDFPEAMQLVVVSVKRDEEKISKIESAVTSAHAEVNMLMKKLREQYATTEGN